MQPRLIEDCDCNKNLLCSKCGGMGFVYLIHTQDGQILKGQREWLKYRRKRELALDVVELEQGPPGAQIVEALDEAADTCADSAEDEAESWLRAHSVTEESIALTPEGTIGEEGVSW